MALGKPSDIAINPQPRFDHEDEPFDQGRYDCNINWCLYNVLMVEWKNDIACRNGVGQAHIHAFDTANPKRKNLQIG